MLDLLHQEADWLQGHFTWVQDSSSRARCLLCAGVKGGGGEGGVLRVSLLGWWHACISAYTYLVEPDVARKLRALAVQACIHSFICSIEQEKLYAIHSVYG